MQTKPRKIISLLLTLALCAGLFAGMPLTVRAAGEIELYQSNAGTVFANLASGDTVKLMEDVTYNREIDVFDKSVIFDLNGHTLNVITTDSYGLHVSTNSVLTLVNPTDGAFNVTGESCGVMSGANSRVEVTNATATGDNGIGAMSGDESLLTVYGNVKATGAHGVGVEATGANSYAIIDGTITVNPTATYIWLYNVGSVAKSGNDAVSDMPGYLQYSDGKPDNGVTVWVKIPGTPTTLSDSNTGVSVDGDIDPGATLSVEEIGGGDSSGDAIRLEAGSGTLLGLYEINIENGSFTGSLTITIPVNPSYNGQTVTIIHDNHGTLETQPAVVTNGAVTFTLTSLSPVGVVLGTVTILPKGYYELPKAMTGSYNISFIMDVDNSADSSGVALGLTDAYSPGTPNALSIDFGTLVDGSYLVTVSYDHATGECIVYFDGYRIGTMRQNRAADPISLAYGSGCILSNFNCDAVPIVTLSSIAVTPPSTTIYTQGDTLNLAGMIVTATYSDGTGKAVTGYTTSQANGAALNIVGTQTVTVSYSENGVTKTAAFTVTILPKGYYELPKAMTGSYNISFIMDVDNSADNSGVALGLTDAYSPSTPNALSIDFGTLVDGRYLVTVSYDHATGECAVYFDGYRIGTMRQNRAADPISLAYGSGCILSNFNCDAVPIVTLSSIAVTPPSKTIYTQGETLDLSGMIVTAAYSDGTDKAVTGYTTSPANGAALNIVGTQTVTVSYEGKTASFTVTVNAKPVVLTGITVIALPAKTIYTQGDTLNLAGMIVTATYSDGNDKTVTNYTTSPVNGAALNNAGTQTVMVSYSENGVTKIATFTVTVNAKPPVTGNTVIVNGVELEYTVVNGVAILEPTQAQMAAILNTPGNTITIDLSAYASIDFKAAAAWFKDVDKDITFLTANGNVTVKAKSLWNNSGKTRIVQIRNGKASIDNI